MQDFVLHMCNFQILNKDKIIQNKSIVNYIKQKKMMSDYFSLFTYLFKNAVKKMKVDSEC